MNDQVLERYIRDYIAAQSGPEVNFLWQGGEPTLAGLDFFRRAIVLQQKYAANKRVTNALQTNGTLLNDRWCEFLRKHQFLVGISIDGPAHLHDRFRVNRRGEPTLQATLNGLAYLQKHAVETNVLTCVHAGNQCHPMQVYEYLKSLGLRHLQLLPVVERVRRQATSARLQLLHADDPRAVEVAPWSVEPQAWGEFLIALFDDWVRHDVATIFVQLFDVTLENWLGMTPSLCVFRETCGGAIALERNGDVYSCDHFVYPQHRLGNVGSTSLEDLVESRQQQNFGDAKKNRLPEQCRQCDVLFACRGECPQHRFAVATNGESGLNYLCAGYLKFFRHVQPYMDFMANEVRAGGIPARVMQFAATC